MVNITKNDFCISEPLTGTQYNRSIDIELNDGLVAGFRLLNIEKLVLFLIRSSANENCKCTEDIGNELEGPALLSPTFEVRILYNVAT